MRKYLFAGAVAGGLLLLGAAPAHADDLPVPGGTQSGLLGGLLNPAGGVNPADGLNLEGPLGGELVDVRPGQNTPDLTGPTGLARPAPDGRPVARTGLGDPRADRTPEDTRPGGRPAADPGGDALPQTGGGVPALADLPVRDLLGGGLPLIGGLMPDGRGDASVTGRESGLLEQGLLGGLGGLLPVRPAINGMPLDGTPVPAGTVPVDTDPAPADPAPATADPTPVVSTPAPSGPGDDAQRLQEEPLDEGAGGGRTFSDGRPVAGEDAEYR
jgi:hypothetical protein